MADDIDVANDAILLAAEECTASIRASLLGDGQEECEDCLAVIPAARRAAIPNASAVHLANRFPKQRGGCGDE